MEGRLDMLGAIFGTKETPKGKPKPMSPDRWKAIVRRTNLRYRKGEKGADAGD